MGTLRKPQSFITGNAFLEEKHHLGVTEKIKTPSISFMKETQKAGGFERELLTGAIDKMEAEISFLEFSTATWKAAAKAYLEGDNASIEVKGSIYRNGKKVPYIFRGKGNVNVEDGDLESGGKIEQTVKMSLVFAQKIVDGYEEYMIDTDNMDGRIDGQAIWDDLRSQVQ